MFHPVFLKIRIRRHNFVIGRKAYYRNIEFDDIKKIDSLFGFGFSTKSFKTSTIPWTIIISEFCTIMSKKFRV